jgi:hypothetical protein
VLVCKRTFDPARHRDTRRSVARAVGAERFPRTWRVPCAIAIGALVVSGAGVAWADPADFTARPTDPGRIGVWGESGNALGGGAVRGPGGAVRFNPADPRRDPANYVLTVVLGTDPATGATCARLGRRFVLGGPGAPGTAGGSGLINQIALGLYPPCPASAAPARPAAAAVALRLWHDQVRLPPPGPRIAPGWGIVGKEAYLEIDGRRDPAPWTFTAFGYTITISARSAYDVDWGDGTVSTGITSQGGPWPVGDVAHPYQADGVYRVTVRQRWTATWSASNGERGAIGEGLATVGNLVFPVRELQAVRDR